MKNEGIHNSLNRFSDRVENYVKYRPDYPQAVFDFLLAEDILRDDNIVADVGSGTGISAFPILKMGLTVIGIEPNTEMRKAAEIFLKEFPKFISSAASAEATNLENNSVDMILAGQAFHWFDQQKCKAEFSRIIKPQGNVVLMWNDRKTDSSDFLKVYEDFLKMFATDYEQVNHKHTQNKSVFSNFFSEGKYSEQSFYNEQCVDFSGLKGRVLSASYMPNQEHPDFDFMLYCLKKIFARYQENGLVTIEYDTKIYYGKIN
jgi:ubiquinone/menaquinone biosynthesis C-methylase UbiE